MFFSVIKRMHLNCSASRYEKRITIFCNTLRLEKVTRACDIPSAQNNYSQLTRYMTKTGFDDSIPFNTDVAWFQFCSVQYNSVEILDVGSFLKRANNCYAGLSAYLVDGYMHCHWVQIMCYFQFAHERHVYGNDLFSALCILDKKKSLSYHSMSPCEERGT